MVFAQESLKPSVATVQRIKRTGCFASNCLANSTDCGSLEAEAAHFRDMPTAHSPESSAYVVEITWGRLATCCRLAIGLALAPGSVLAPETLPKGPAFAHVDSVTGVSRDRSSATGTLPRSGLADN